MADAIRLIRTAAVALINGDTALQTLMGRSTRLITPWKSLRLDAGLPIIAYAIADTTQTGKEADTRRCALLLSVYAEGNDALALAENVCTRLEAVITAPALAPTVDATPLLLHRRYPPVGDGGDDTTESERELSRGLERADLEIELEFTQAAA